MTRPRNAINFRTIRVRNFIFLQAWRSQHLRLILSRCQVSIDSKYNICLETLKFGIHTFNTWLTLTLDRLKLGTVKPVYYSHHWDSKKLAFVQSLRRSAQSLFAVYSYKIAISFGKLWLNLAVVDRWPLFRGGC